MSRNHYLPRFGRRSNLAASALVAGLVLAIAVPGTPAYADSVRDDSWQVNALELPELHKVTQGDGVVVAVVDTGVDPSHPDLKGSVLPGFDLYDGTTKGQVDRTGHGTGMASLIAGHGHGPGGRDGVLGVAPHAKILPITVHPKKPGIIPPAGIAIGIDWAVDHGADVINVSLSSSRNDSIARAVERAFNKNVIVVAAVGNRSDDIMIGDPARYPGAIAVTGTDRNGKLGPESITDQKETDIAAPSVDLVHATLNGKYVTATGISGATALVSGAVALVRAKYPKLTANRMFQRMLATTKEAGAPGKDGDFGWGILDLRRALTGEPDGRGSPASASPSASAEAAPPGQRSGTDAPWWLYALTALGLLLAVLAVLTLAIVLPIRAARRRRRARLAQAGPPLAGAPPLAPAPQVGGSTPPASWPATPAPPGDPAVWRRPSDPEGPPRS